MVNRSAPGTSYREAASALAPQAVSEYLALSSWNLQRRDEVKEIWELKEPGGKAVGRLMLPLATEYTDFRDRFHEALLALGRINDWDAGELQEHVLATRADLFFVRLDQPTADGTIPFKQAETTIEAIYRMLRSAATAVAAPRSEGRYQLPAVVNSFLEDDVRLGHTKRGSFIFTVAVRFSDRAAPHQPLPETDANAATGGVFSRSVMETLAYNLETVRDMTYGRRLRSVQAEGYVSIRSGLLEPLEDMAKPAGLRAVELSFQWAIALPNPNVGMEPIKLEQSALADFSPLVREATYETTVPKVRRSGALVGPVVSLTREGVDEEGAEIGEIVILAEIGRGKPRNVYVRLSGRDHELAIQAYRSQLPMRVSGELVFERQRWRLTGSIEVDVDSLGQLPGNPPHSP
jgi:hypothetical protein